MSRKLDSETLVKPSKFAHFVLRVRDLEASIAWYQKVLGMEVVHRTPMLAFLTYDDEHHRMALLQTPGAEPPEPGSPGLDHVAYSLGSLGELLGNYRRLKALGILPGLPINHGVTTSMYYQDPDGNGVEFQVDNFESKEDLQAFMKSDTFVANPLGTPYDPEKLAERYENGDPLEELVQQGSA